MQDPQPWQVLSSQYLLDRQPYMTLREDRVQLPNGVILDQYFVFEYPDWASVLAVTTSGKIVLVRQYRHGIGSVHYELPAGVIDPGETPLKSAKRELLEETGYGGGQWQDFVALSANPATHTNTCHIFLVTGVELLKKPEYEHSEDMTVHLLSPDEVLAALRSGGVMQALHAAALWRWFAEGKPSSPTLSASF